MYKLAEMESIGRSLRNEVYKNGKAAPLHLKNNRTWDRFNTLRKEVYSNAKNAANIVGRFIAKNKERIAHSHLKGPYTNERAAKAQKINRELRVLGNKLLYGVRALNKIKNSMEKSRQAARSMGRAKGLAIKQHRSYMPPNKNAGLPYGGNKYREAKQRFNQRKS
jgi:hypothetical protein